jgi:hypothetical protein
MNTILKEAFPMKNIKIPRSYRLSSELIGQLDYLAEHMGGITDTDVITAAVAALFYSAKKNEQAPLLAALIPCGEAGYELRVEGSVLLTCGQGTVDALPDPFRTAVMDGKMTPESALTGLILAATWAREEIVYNHALISLFVSNSTSVIPGPK